MTTLPHSQNEALRVTLPYPPSANRYWRNVKGRMLISRDARAYKEVAAGLALAAGLRPLIGDVAVKLAIYRPQKSGDLDNFQKVVIDALRGVAYVDDSQIVRIEASRFEDKHNPRVEFEVRRVGTQREAF